MDYIYWFQEISATQVDQVGGKGANLGELTRAGLLVPPGFCVVSSAYQDYLKTTQLDQVIEAVLAQTDLDDRVDIECKSAQIRQAILAQPILPEIAKQVTDSFHQLLMDNEGRLPPDVSLAVRSSATAEDQSKASFAGQLETYLNIRGESSLLEHIQRCWASLWTDRVVAYIANQGIDHRSVSMSVVVQAMIPSEFSGILFTANPITGRADEVVMNASWGLGEAIVSGLVSPDTLTVRKCDGQILSRQIGDKQCMIVYAAGGGTEELPVPERLRHSSVLSERQVSELLKLGIQVEAHYGKPQDIEWGYSNGCWYLLQSRPITTLSVKTEQEYPRGNFNRSMFIDIFPEPSSPIFLSVIEHLFKGMLDFTFQSFGFEPPQDIQAIGIFYNQAYFNCDYIEAAFQPLSPAVREPLIAHAVNPFGRQAETFNFELSRPFLRMIVRMLRFMVRFPKQLPDLLAKYHQEIAQAAAYPFESASDTDIAALIHRVPYEYASKPLNYDYLMLNVIDNTYRLLGAFLKRYYGADTDQVVAKLISGVTGNVTMETNKRIWDLAQIAKSSPEISQILRDHHAYQQTRTFLKQYPEGRAFLQSLDRFLVEYGHREVRMDILDPTWCDDPEPVLFFIRSYLDVDEDRSPHRQQARLTKEREQLTGFVLNDIEKGLPGRLLIAPLFRWILQQTQIHTRERDTMHFEMTRIFPPLRHMFLELGKRWIARGLLDQEEDIFFLTMEEIKDIAETPRPMQATALARKQEFLTNQSRPCPIIIHNGEEIYSQDTDLGDRQDSAMEGIPGSPGKAVGVTRIVLNREEFGKLKKGEILVAPLTTPVWTPLFALAGGLVTEAGGILSHGAIVAREYGIPAVMSVPGATKFLKDGQRVTVDGSKGLIHLEMEA
jgi:phosphoenolpyruvate synthase/pyruvate phosphate dikinase